MITTHAKPLKAVDLMKLYGKVRFSWNLRTDHLVWNGPINRLFESNVSLSTGSSFLSRLTTTSFWRRFSEIDKCEKDDYSISYTITLPNQLPCYVIETATLIRNDRGLPERLEGYIQVCDNADLKDQKDYTGYDQLTGYPQKEVLLENLTCLVEQTKGEFAPGGYLVFCIDKLSLIYFLYGLDALKESLLQVGSTLKKFTRFNDTIGRINGCCFATVLRDTDEKGVYKAANRLVNTCSSLRIKTKIEIFSPTVSVGGTSFRDSITPIEIIRQSEQGLFEMQNMKGTGVVIKTLKETPSVSDGKRPKYRIADIKNKAKKDARKNKDYKRNIA